MGTARWEDLFLSSCEVPPMCPQKLLSTSLSLYPPVCRPVGAPGPPPAAGHSKEAQSHETPGTGAVSPAWLPLLALMLLLTSPVPSISAAAIFLTQPLTFHTDREANYTSKTFCDYLKSLEVTQSFSKAHVPYDNSVMESFFSNLKREELYRTKYRSENEFKTAVSNGFLQRTTSPCKNGHKTPLKKELDFCSKQAGLSGTTN